MNRPHQALRPLFLALALAASGAAYADKYSDAFAKAQQYAQKNDRPAAIIELKNALQAKPDAADARLLLGELYLQEGNLPAAEKELDRARELKAARTRWVKPLARVWMTALKPKDILDKIQAEAGDSVALRADIAAYRGLANLQSAAPQEAEKLFAEAVGLVPAHAEGNFGQAQMARLRNDLDKAETLLATAMKTDPGFVNNHVLDAELKLARGNKDAAITAISKAIEIAPYDVRVRIARAELQILRNDPKAAWSDVDNILANSPKNPLANFIKARLLLLDNKEDAAVEALNDALAVYSNYVEAQILLGLIHTRKGNYRQADELLKRALSVQTGNIALLRLMTYTQLGLGNFDEAIAYADKALAINPQDVQTLSMKANVLVRKGKADQAMEVMQQAVQLAPDADQLRAGLAMLQMYEGDSKGAVVELERAAKDDTTVNVSSALLVSTYLASGEIDKGAKLAGDLYAKDKTAIASNLLGMVKLAQKDVAGAEKLFQEALQRDSKFFTANINLARTAFARGDFKSAQARLDEVLKQQPKMTGAAMMKAQLFDAQNDRANALVWLRKAWDFDKSSLSTAEPYIKRLVAEGKNGDALSAAQELVNLAPQAAGAQQLLALAHASNKNMSSAITALRRAIQLSPNSAAFYLALSDAYVVSGDKSSAYRALDDLQRVDAKNITAQMALARLDMMDKKFADAHGRASKLLSLHKDQPFGLQLNGEVFMAEGKFAEAAAEYEKAYKLRPTAQSAGAYSNAMQAAGKSAQADALFRDYISKFPNAADNPVARFGLASLYQSNKRIDDALREYHALEKMDAKNALMLNNITWLYSEKGDTAKTREYLTRLEAVAPGNPSMLDTLGWVHVKLGNTEKGLDYLKQALAKAPNMTDAQYHAAVAYEKLGKKDEARRLLKKLLEQKAPFADRSAAEQLYAKVQ